MSRIFMETPEQEAALDALNSSYRTSSEIKDGRAICAIQLIDRVTGSVWHEATAPSHGEALEIALKTAKVGSKPLTTAEVAAQAVALADENAKLREMVEALNAQQATSPKRIKAQSQDNT
jgi:hypothetical protein